ncbi:MAG: DUF4268 domain-containing protein [Steroidobacteraceae bacterium]
MFRVDGKANRISRLESTSFSDLGFGERHHLQEWLANEPSALGEDLLIIQKEFAGFDETKERLDLLAIDKEGSLVVIENKLDDSGRDLVWQGLKYASYCSTLSKTSIAAIFQKHLDRTGQAGSAQEKICGFLDVEDFDEAKLNTGNRQRLIFVAAQFRKEVTSTALWLIRHGVNLKCFKATPYRHEQLILLNLEQVIPLAEAEELMIGISEKEQQEDSTERVDATRHTLRLEFWRKLLDSMEAEGFDLYSGVSPSRDHWLNAGSGVSGAHYALIFGQGEARVDFSMSSPSLEQNKAMFDYLHSRKGTIESVFGEQLVWRRMDENKASIVQFSKAFEGHEKENWPAMIDWLITHMKKLKQAFEPEISNLRQVRNNVKQARGTIAIS